MSLCMFPLPPLSVPLPASYCLRELYVAAFLNLFYNLVSYSDTCFILHFFHCLQDPNSWLPLPALVYRVWKALHFTLLSGSVRRDAYFAYKHSSEFWCTLFLLYLSVLWLKQGLREDEGGSECELRLELLSFNIHNCWKDMLTSDDSSAGFLSSQNYWCFGPDNYLLGGRGLSFALQDVHQHPWPLPTISQ